MRRRLLLWLMQTHFYKWLLHSVIPYIRFTTYYTSMSGVSFHAGHDVLEPGDIILAVDRKKLTSLLIPGNFSHAALCVGKHPDAAFEVIEMTHDDCVRRHFFEACKESDRVLILRAPWTPEQKVRAIARAEEFFEAKVPYDQEFVLGVKALYCSELILACDVDKVLRFDLSDLAGLGRLYLSPDGIAACPDMIVVWDSQN